MKKFAKILGFLGFFVTLATAQIGTAWAAGAVRCEAGYYLPAESDECQECPGTVSVSGTNVGVYCLGSGEQEWFPGESAQGLRYCNDDKACGDSSNWEYTRVGAESEADCNGGPMNGCSCHYPNDFCPDGFTCLYNRNFTVTGTNFCGTCVIDEENTNTWCPLTCPKSCDNGTCTCPDDNCTGYEVVNNLPGVHYCGTATNSCDVTHLIQGENTSNAQIVEANPLNYQCSALGECKVECSHEGNPTCDYPGATCEWDLNTPAKTGYQQGDDCIDPQTNQPIEQFDCNIIITGCSNSCQYWDANLKQCVTYTTDVTYKCNGTTQQGPTVTCGTDYFVNRNPNAINGNYVINLDTSGCVPAGQVFSNWKLSIDNSQHSNDDRFSWNYTDSEAKFEAEWDDDKLYVYYNRYGGAWVQANPPAGDMEAFTISDLQPDGLTKYWTLTRDNSIFRGWCDDEYYGKDSAWMDAHCHSPYTIPANTTSDVYLYAWWECTDGYSLGSDYQCAANGIDVIYTCTAPDSNQSTINRSFSNDATVGVAYTIRSVGTNESDHQVICSFPGYYLENNYRWKRVGSNPEELYEPGLMDSPWAYTNTQTFELSGDYWKPNTYRVLYKCGSIDGTSVTGNDTADSATYGQPYYVATNIYNSFINNCSELNGYVVDYWTFEDQTTPRYGTGEQFNNPNGWNLAADDHYFVAHWVQTGGALTLDPNGGSASTPAELYTTQGTGVYLDPTRTQQMSTDSNGLTTNPSKSASVQIYPNGTGANFQWNGSTITHPSSVNDDIALDFTGFYNDDDGEGNIKLCIGTDKFITSDGIAIGKSYDVSEQHTWYAHWDSRQVYLPVPTRAGYDFLGWYDDQTNGVWVSDGDEYYEVSGDVELYAHWGIACRSVSFDENGGTSTGGGNNGRFWKISDQTGWYGDAACANGITPNVGNTRPTKENATFIGYDDTVSAPTVRIFDNLGAITTGGENWTITQNATLYAQYECVAPYHLMDDGSCGSCPGGYFFNPESQNPNHCDTCDQYLNAPYGTWHTRSPYNWSVKQCYRVCDGVGDTQQTCDVVNTVSSEMEQFLTENLINGNTGKQISFYGNEFATSGAFNTCNSETGVTNCPQGFLAGGASGANKLMAAAVDFYEKRDLNGVYELNGKRYIVGGRRVAYGVYKLNDGFVWSQVVGDAQLEGNPGIISIIYPATLAPVAANPEHHTFSGYGYPESNPSQNLFVDSNYSLTSGSDGNAEEIIDFANDNNYSNMSPIIGDSNYTRNLYAKYTAANFYTVKYVCGAHGTFVNGMSMQNTATYGQVYKVAYDGEQLIAQCQANEGYVLKTDGDRRPEWELNNTDGGNPYTGYTGDTISSWNYTAFDPANTPTFTAQYDCDRGYTWNTEHTACVSISGTACPAELSAGSHASMIGEPTINGDGECVYTIKCDLCQTSGVYGCYTHDPISNGQFTQLGAQYDGTVLDDVSCTPADFCVTLDSNGGNGGIGTLCETYGEGWHKSGSEGFIDSLDSSDLPTWVDNSQVFAGYWTLQNGGNMEIGSEGSIVANNTILEDNNQTWYAHWGDGTGYTVTFKCDGDTQWTETLPVYPPQDINVPQRQCLRTGYTFTNWVDTSHDVTIPANNLTFNWTGEFNSVLTPDWTANEYNVTYKCNEQAEGTIDPTQAEFDHDYYVQPHNDNIVRCAEPEGKVFVKWSLNTTPDATLIAEDQNITWQYDISNPIFTAQWTDGCYEVTFNNDRHGGQPIISTLKFYKQGTRWYANTEAKCDGDSISPSVAGMLPTKEHASFIGYDDEDGTDQRIFDGNGYLTYDASTWTITGDTTLYAQYDCDDGYTLDGTTCVLDSSNFHMITLDENVGNLHGDNSDPTVLYTIEGDTTVYKNAERTEPFSRLDENPKKYAYVTFHFCDGDDNSCEQPSNQNAIKNAYFTFGGFYIQHPDEYARYISSDGWITPLGGQVASTYEYNRTWDAVWDEHGTVTSWPDDPTNPDSAYAFGGWYTERNCVGTQMTDDDHFTADTELYACWERNSCPDDEILIGIECKKKCWVNCTWTGAPTNPAACPSNIASIPDVVNCTYDLTSPVPQGPGYLQSPESTQCLDATTNQLITPYSPCDYTVNCTPPKVWNPSTSSCVYPSGTLWNVKFMCDTDGSLVQEYNISLNTPINVPDNSVTTCANTGYSFTNWKDTAHPSASLVAGANNVPWTHEYNATYTPDWNDGNVYHVNLHAYSCDDPTNPDLTGTFNSYTGVQELWEKYNVAWYKNAGLDDQITTLSSLQLPTLSGWMFGGYNKTDGMPRLSCDNGTCENLSPTLIRDNEDWCAVWSKCNANEYWNNGDCISCSTATGGQYPYAAMGATSINDCYNRPCYRDCQPNFSACNIPHAETYTYVNESFIGSMYFPNTNSSACQLDIWLPETSGTVPNCQCRVATCETGYHPNNDNTACIPNNYTITLNSHIDGFDGHGHVSSPTVLYTKYDHGAYLESSYIRLMGTNGENPLDSVPEKSANVVLYGNGGTFTWNGYPVQQATAPANFAFQGFFVSEYANGAPYINNNGVITSSGDQVAKQNQSDSTVWHAQWQSGSITLPTPQRQCYDFNGWWTDQYNGTWAGAGGMPYSPTIAMTNLYAHWTAGTYNITYHNGNTIYSGCYQTSYTYGNSVTISCLINPSSGSHQVFQGWCTDPELTVGCTQNPVISNTDCGDKDYYAWWGCESGYNMENGVCVPNASELCPATTLPNNSHATFVSGVPNDGGTQCIYTLKCDACIGCNSSLYTCYTNGNSANNNGIFTVIGNIGDANVLADVRCNPTEYDVYYRCDDNSQEYAAPTKAVYGQAYSVEYNPHNNANGGQLNCQSDNQLFNGWKFNNQIYYPGTSNYMINSWNYCNITPIFTASYGPCPAGEVYVPSLGKCRPSCPVPCTWAGYPVNPAQCPTPQYPAGATCWYLEGNPAAQTGYVPEYDPNACLNPMTDATITPQTCNVDPTQDPICPEYQHWENNTCEWNTYHVTLDSNNGIEGSNFVSKLFEKYTIGWSRTDNSFTYSLNLDPDELPSPSETCKVFKGYFNRRSGGQQMIQADGYVSLDGYQPLPSTTITDNNRKWYAQYIDNPGTFTIKFRCSANGGDIYSYTVHMGDTNLLAPVATVCSGVAFNQWKGSTHPEILLNTSSYFTWDHCFDEVFVPDTKAVYRVDLNENGGTFPADDYQELWYAVDMGWYKNAGLTTQITYIPGNSLPTKPGSNFNGWLDNATQQPRGNFSGTNWNLPNSISANETWNAQWGPCNPNEYWDGGVCKNCSDQTSGAFPYAVPGATSIGQCYNTCDEQCKWNSSIAASCNIPNAISYEPDEISYPGKRYFNNQLVCSLDIWAPNPQGTIPNCGCIPTACEPGYILNGQSCVEDEKHTITLESHIIHGASSDPDVLYTWHNRGVYLYSNYTGEMRANQNPLSENPLNYAIVTFNLNGQGASLIWNGQTYMGSMDANVLFDYQGFWKSVNGSPRYIDVDGHINGSGIAAGTGYTDDATWHARWQSRTLGTISSSGNDLPVPRRPGFVFDGWYDLSMGGNQVDSSSLVNNDMTVYAHWSDVIYTVNLVSDRNNCQPSSNTPTKLFEKYNVGWNRDTTGRFDRDLLLNDDELPIPNAGYEFKGYYDALSGGDRVIRPDGRVEQEPNYTDNNHTWYARCGRPTGPFTITFRCGAGEEPLPNYTQSVQNGGTVSVPPKSACPNAGYTFTSWMGDHNTTFTARDTEYTATWNDVYANEDFTPNWNNGNVYYVTLAQTDATEPGIEILYEKYDNGWGYTANGSFNVTRLSGSQLPRRSGYVFAGYKYNDVPMVYVSNGQWRLPDPTVLTDNNQVWEPDWSQCEQGEYWDGNKCYPCPYGFTDNPHAIGAEQCYGNCEYDCQDSGCPSPLPVGMQSCTPNHSDYPQWGIKYNRPGATCLPQGQQSLPICPNDIICNNGYDLVGTECRDNRYTITLDSNLYNDNGTLANPSTLYTWFNHGVYRDYGRTYMMTPDDYPLASGTPSTYATVTLNGNGAMFNWHDMYGGQLSDNVDFVFDGFYDTTGAVSDPVIDIDRYITGAGQSIGTTAQNNQTWRASWRNGSVDLPSISRDGYTFDGWWTACDGGTRVSMGNQTITVSGDRTLCAHWSGKSYTVTYNCNSEDGQGGSATDNQLAYQNTSYIVRENFIPCSKPATETTRAYEFENWKFNLNSNTYWPGDPILWIFTDDNPTFNAHYKECPDGSYFDGSCKTCPTGYDHSNINATSPQHCYKTCNVEIPCTQPVSDCPNEEGVLTCVYPQLTSSVSGAQYNGSNECVHDVPSTQYCEPFTIMCKPGYTPDHYLSTDTGTHCTKLADHEITLDANCGQGTVIPGDQEKLYTTENTGVYLNPARTNAYEMRANRNPLVAEDLPRCIVTATFNHCDNGDENCDGATTEQKTVDLGFNGYYKAETNGTRYTDTRQEDGQLKSYITQQGIDAGKGYTANATWFAQWLDGQVGSQKWPSAPTRTGTCGVTYEFVDWYTAANGGTSVSYNTPVSEDVTWYAHWCESCPTSAITNGSCSDAGCVARFTCNDGYAWDETLCQCVAATGLTLTYQPNGGTPDADYTEDRYFGETFTTRGGNTYTKVGHIIAKWANVGVGGGSFPLLAHSYTYNYNGNTTLEPEWKQCTCTFDANSGVESCDANIVTNNTCTPNVVCKPGYVNGHYTCINEHLETCTAMCNICPAGTYQNGDQCSPCAGNTMSAAGATQCEPCDPGYTANEEHTQCVGNLITIDWDENGGRLVDNGICQFCTEGCVDITCESCGTYSDNTLTLANVTHSNSAMQFLGWKLFMGDSTYPAGTNVMCTHDNVGVYSGISTKIQAQWNECQCSDQLNPHVVCRPVIVDDVCRHVYWCDSVGYNIVGDDYSNTSPYCDPKTFDVTYNCGVGATGTPLISADTATYDDTYIVKNAGGVNCQKVGFNFVGWLFSGNGQVYQPGDRVPDDQHAWQYTIGQTFTAQYTNIQCASDEILIGNGCVKCNCTIGTGATSTSCGTLSTNSNTCEWTHPVTCQTGFVTPAWSCMGTGNTNCTASCSVCPENQVEVGGSCVDCECTPDTTTGAVSCGTRSVSNNMCNWGPAICTPGHHNPNITCSGSSNQSCEATCGTCPANTYGPDGLECIQCPDGYTSPAGSTSIEDCYNNPTSYTITYRPNGGVNPQTGNNRPVPQPVTYWANFTTLMGTTFTMDNHILTRWNLVGDDTSTFDKHQDPDTNQYYAKLNEYYDHYNTLGDTVLYAHWEQCTCDADNCTTYATDSNTCACSATCPTGYTYGGCNCNGTDCAPTCTQCAEIEVSINNECVECECTPGAGAATCGTLSTIGNICEWTPSCLDRFVNVNANCTGIGNTTCNPTCTECPAGWISNANHTECEICPANTYQSGNTCVDCQTGYVSPAGSSSADACVPGAHTIHYLSNNGMNQTYDQSVTYGQSFMTEGGTRFTYTNHIMTHWNVESGASSTFTNGTATLSGNYTYGDTTDTTLSAQWAQCTCEAGTGVASCETYSNANACDATVTCETGYSNPQLNCNGTTCTATCTLGGSNAVYKCGTGIGTGYSTYVNYGATHTILTNAFVGCYRDNSTFAGWAFNGDNNIYFDNVGATVTWDYTTDKEFEARWCSNCPVVEHGTNLLTIPEPGLCRCDLTCDTGYHVENGTCEPNVYPNENGITYKPNGGTPNRNYTQSVTYDAPFTTLDWSVEHYTKAHHILKGWDVESGGAGTFNGGYADLGREYIYKTDGATSLLAKWIECGINEISLDNRCQQCQCTENAGVTSCETRATNNDTCSCSGECAAGYINAGCNCNGTNCTQSCTKCEDNQVSVNNACENCKCEKNIDGIEGIISGCGFVSNNGNTCNWNPTTCRLGYGYPDLTCTETEHNNNCTASCTICPAGTYGDNGVECKPCPEGKTSLAGATSIRECFIDPNSCAPDEHIEHGECVSNTRACSIPDATSAARIWNPAIGTYGPCTVVECDTANGYHESGNACVRDTCVVAHGSAESEYSGGQWECFVTKCDPGYEPSSDYKSCVECANRYVDGDIAVSGYIYECEIAACMYQGQKYALQNGECVPICENASDETGTKVWDERTKKCIRTCKPGYKMW